MDECLLFGRLHPFCVRFLRKQEDKNTLLPTVSMRASRGMGHRNRR